MPIDTSFLRNAAVPAEFPSPYEAYQKALTLRELVDRRRQNEELRAHQRVLWQQAEEDRARKMSLIDLLRRNPNATPEQMAEVDPLSSIPLVKERRLTEEAEQRAKKEQRLAQETEQKMLRSKQTWLGRLAGSLLKIPPGEKRTQLFNQYTGGMVEADMLTPEEASEHLGDDATLWMLYERGLGPEAAQDLRDKIAKAAREEEIHRPTVAKARAEATKARQEAGTEPMSPLQTAQLVPAEEREFQAYAPSYYAAKGIKTPTPADEQAARREFVMLKHPPPQPSAGMTPGAEAQQRRLTQAAIDARATAAAREVGQKPLSAEAAKIHAVAISLVPELNQLKTALQKGGRTAITGILTGTDTNLRRLAENAADKVGRLRSGGAVNPNEEARFMGQIARKMDVVTGDTSAAIAAIDRLIEEAQGVSRSMVPQRAGAPPAAPGGGKPYKKGDDPMRLE